MASINDKLAREKYIGEPESNSHNNEHVPHHSQNIEEQKHNKKEFLFTWIMCEAQEDKVSQIFPWFHLLFYDYWFQILEIVHL